MLGMSADRRALAAVHAFNNAAGVALWEHSPLTPHVTEGPLRVLQEALLAKLTDAEAKAWRKWWKERDAEMAQAAGQRMTFRPCEG
jgi:hypothetical protein